MYLNLNLDGFRFTPEIVSLLLEIEEFKGGWKAYGNLAPERLTELQRIATIESIGSSTRIEGAKLSDAEVSRILAGLSTQSFRSRDEEEVAGYALLMNEIYASWEEMPLTENVIKQMHGIMMRPSTKDERHRGAYKTLENNVAAFDSNGRPIGVPNLRLAEGKFPSLIIIGMFVAAFLAVHPFQDGNGRLSRALTMLLLMRAGYVYAPYSSLESIIEASKQNYYVSLRATQKTLHEKEPNWNVWIVYFLNALAKQVRSLKIKVEEEHLLRAMPEISMRIIEAVKAHGSLSISETEGLLRINKFTLRAHFKRLTDEGLLMRIGRGRSTKYAIRHG